jgi:hypothetical protein
MRHHMSLIARSWLLRLIPLAAALLAATSAAAQPQDALRPGWTFTPALSLSGGWDDNVMLVGVDEPSVGDYVTALVPRGALTFQGRRLILTTGYQGSFTMHRELSDLNSLNQSGRASLNYRTTPRTSLVFDQSFASSRTTDTLDLVGVPFRRVGNRTAVTQGGIEARLTPRTRMKAGYAFRLVDFDDAAEQFITFAGGHEHHFSGSMDFRLAPRLTLGGFYDMRRVVVTQSLEVVPVQQSAATAEYRLAQPVTLTGSLGVSHLAAGLTHEARTGATWSAGITGKLRYVEISAHYQRSVVPSFGFGGTAHNEQLVGSVAGAFAGSRGYWQAGIAWRNTEPLIVGPPVTNSVWLSSVAGYTLTPWMRLEGYHHLTRQDTRRAGGLAQRNRIGFQIVTAKPMRLAR